MQRILDPLLLVLSFLYFTRRTLCQEIPPIACPEYFQYLSYNDMYIGKVTIPVSSTSGTTILELRFSQRGATNGAYGRVVTFYDKDTTRENLKNGLGLVYRVDFPFVNVLPKLTRISINGQEICRASGYPPPSSVLRMQHNLTISETIIHETKPFAIESGNNGNNYITYREEPSRNPFTNTVGNPFMQNFDQYFTNPPTRVNTQSNPFIQLATTRSPIYQQTRPILVSRPYNTTIRLEPTSTQIDYGREPVTRPIASIPQIPSSPTFNQNSQIVSSPNRIAQICGRRTSSVRTFIHHGTDLIRGQFPWLTAMYRKISGGVEFLCSGSLVSAKTVITAAHCFRLNIKAENIVLYLGRYDLENYDEVGYLPRQVEKLHINPEYNVNRLADADIAIMHLIEPVPFTEYISPICLWTESEDLAQIVGLKGFVAGWGADEKNRPITNIPKMINATIHTDIECRSVEGFSALLTPRTICAGNRDGSGPCMGDSGSGLMIERNNRWTLRGVVSAGQVVDGQCMLQDSFVVYCDLAKHRSWVERHMAY